MVSADGTTIRWEGDSAAPVLVMVHGGWSTIDSLIPLADALGDRVACLRVGRRGYGVSGDVPSYSYEREVEDLAAIFALLPRPHWLFGSSSGAVVALCAARALRPDKLVLFEPPLAVDGPLMGDQRVALAQAALARGDNVGALRVAIATAAGFDDVDVPPTVMTGLQSLPDWEQRERLIPAWVREFPELDALAGHGDDFANVTCPVLLLSGSKTERHHRRAVDRLGETLPQCRTVVFDGLRHTAPIDAPQTIADSIAPFLLAD